MKIHLWKTCVNKHFQLRTHVLEPALAFSVACYASKSLWKLLVALPAPYHSLASSWLGFPAPFSSKHTESMVSSVSSVLYFLQYLIPLPCSPAILA